MDFSIPLSIEDARLLVTALTTHVETWRHHYEEDGGRTHTPDEWDAVRMESGQLIWRLEEAAVLPGKVLEHSAYAVQPPEDDDDDDDDGPGVLEPRRPTPPPPSARQYKG